MLSVNYTALIVFVVVWVLVVLLTKLFFNPVRRVREERERDISRRNEELQKTLDSCKEGILKIEKSLQSARAESGRIKEEAAKEAQKEKSILLSEISDESRKSVEKAREEIQAQTEVLKRELSSRAAFFAEEIEKRVLN